MNLFLRISAVKIFQNISGAVLCISLEKYMNPNSVITPTWLSEIMSFLDSLFLHQAEDKRESQPAAEPATYLFMNEMLEGRGGKEHCGHSKFSFPIFVGGWSQQYHIKANPNSDVKLNGGFRFF